MKPQPVLLTSPTSVMAELARGVDENSIFRALFAANPDAHLVADGSGTIVLANPAACAMFGYANDELVGLGIARAMRPTARAMPINRARGPWEPGWNWSPSDAMVRW
jgi:PAS domain-containing protein